jgi:hypothetical protein
MHTKKELKKANLFDLKVRMSVEVVHPLLKIRKQQLRFRKHVNLEPLIEVFLGRSY